MWWRNNLTGSVAGIIKGEKGDKTKPSGWRGRSHRPPEETPQNLERSAEAETEEETNHAASREEERDRDEALQRSMKGASIIQQL